ncbi:Kinetochore-associated protein 1 [Caenorhabditis elegans]|uniref:Kinetochore-associated protein 1 n=2 Tax=Caenorhabditis elegans TaxID=6239 RepID=G5ECP7_CAEEL|nr:Kinetochore-associated protein 1 [Caenorhabditis elegans]CAB08562.4 Kinetochore-associated protein 1 [Caenorhabditis elegans]
MTSLPAPSEICSVSGYDRAAFASGKTIIILENGDVKHVDFAEEQPILKSMKLLGRVTALSVSNDFSIFAVAIEEENVAKVVVYSLELAIGEEKAVYGTQYLSTEMCISQAAEIIACLSVLEERVHLQTFDVKDGINNCTGNIIAEKVPKNWQISFCPADEGVLCALGGGTAYLLRASGGHIENFSTILLPGVTCHDWANDVNIMFGSTTGFLHIYRETISLEVVDIRKLSEKILNDSVNIGIISIRSTTRRLACQTGSGIILIFDSNAENGPSWSSCRALIISDFLLKSYHSLSFDFGDENLLYDSGNALQRISIQYLSKLNSFDGDVVTVRHCNKVVGLRATDSTIITLDDTGLFVVFSKLTNRVLCSSRVPDAFFFTVLAASHKLLVVTKTCVESYTVMLDGLKAAESIFEKELIMAAIDSYDMSTLAILYETGFIVFRTEDRSILMSEQIAGRKDTKQMLFSRDNKFLMFLTKSDNVFCVDLSSKKILWSTDYKLHFFQSMGYSNTTLLLLNQKFIVSRIKHGKDLSNVNMHASDIGFSITSELIEGNNNFVFITADCGEVLCSAASALDEPFVVKSKIKKLRITAIRAFDDEFLVGYENGSVGVLKLTDKVPDEVQDIILCYFTGVINLKSLLRDINSERNLIKENTEKFLNLFTTRTNNELQQIKTEFDETMKNYKERVKTFERDFNESEAIKQRTISNLKGLYEDESTHQKRKYETMIEDQIRKSFRQLEEKQNEIKTIKDDAERKHRDMIGSFHITEKQFSIKAANNQLEIENLKKTIKELKFETLKKHEELGALRDEKEANTQKLKENHREDVELLEAEIWALKATCVQLNEQRDHIGDENAKVNSMLRIAKQQIEHTREENQRQEAEIQSLKELVQKLRNKENEITRTYTKVKKNYSIQTKQYHEVLQQSHLWKRRMQDLEARIDQLAGCVYDPRRLEHSVLNLLAKSQNVDLDKRYKAPL